MGKVAGKRNKPPSGPGGAAKEGSVPKKAKGDKKKKKKKAKKTREELSKHVGSIEGGCVSVCVCVYVHC